MKTGIVLTGILLATAIVLFHPGSRGEKERGFLSVDGNRVVDASGAPVVLRGFNVELKHFRNILGEKDIRRIADLGANNIRLVMDYRDLEAGPYRYREDGFALLDDVLAWCERYGIHVILDMHLAPGRQNPHDFVVHRENVYEFWAKREFQERFYALWAEIAKRYAGRCIIAGYDLLNEPVPPATKDYADVVEAVTERIRSYDKKHILIVEEALMPDGKKELIVSDDTNTLYSIHFFYPPQFSFYVTTTDRRIIRYPGEMATKGDKISDTRAFPITGDSDWRKVTVRVVPPGDAEVLQVHISSDGNAGSIWVDDVSLEVDGRAIDLPAPLVSNHSFETDYPGIRWNTGGSCVTMSDKTSHTGRYALLFSGCERPAYAESSLVEVAGREYILSAWYKSENATGANQISLAWYKKRVIGYIDRKGLTEQMRYAVEFKTSHNVPLYVGEFTGHANPEKESLRKYLADLLAIFEQEGFHWSFWEYYSEYAGVGLYGGNDVRLVNPEGLSVLETYYRKHPGPPRGVEREWKDRTM